MKLAIVILNWNGKALLEIFLPIVLKYSGSEAVGVFVADNGSTDNSLEFLKQNFPDVEIIQLDKNYGFAEGYNKALDQIEAEYYVLLNSDVEVTENWTAPIIKYLDDNQDVAACMPKILSYNNKNNFEYAGAAGGFIDKFGYPFCRGRIIATIEEDKQQYDETTDIFWATGACMFVRSKLYHAAGGFDNDFFAHMEEIDLCWRLKNMGHRIVYIPDVAVYHLGGGTLPNNTPQKLYLNYRNNLMLLFKNLPRKKLVSTLILRMLLDGASSLVYLTRFSFRFFFSVFKAHLSFYKSIGKLIDKRRKMKEKFNNISHPEIYKNSIVYDFYFRKKQKFTDIKFISP